MAGRRLVPAALRLRAGRRLAADRDRLRTGQAIRPGLAVGLRAVSRTAGLRTWSDYFERKSSSTPRDAGHYRAKFGDRRVFTCPADPDVVNNVWAPADLYGLVGYAANEDVFGFTRRADDNDVPDQCWARGKRSTEHESGRFRRLAGNVERAEDTTALAWFADGGADGEWAEPNLLVSDRANGPFLGDHQEQWNRLPSRRHPRGAVNVVFADGHAATARPSFVTDPDDARRQRYAPRVRVSPYR